MTSAPSFVPIKIFGSNFKQSDWMLRIFNQSKCLIIMQHYIYATWAVAVALDFRGSNPVISKNLYSIFTVNYIELTKIKKKRSGMAH